MTHFIETSNTTYLWFGEVKFYQNYKAAVDSVFKKIETAISDEYFKKNLLALTPIKSDLNTDSVTIRNIIQRLRKNPTASITQMVSDFNLKLIYPILIICEIKNDYDSTIREIVNYIQTKYSGITFSTSIPYELFLILVPVNQVKKLKDNLVRKWINVQPPLTLL